MKTTTRLLLAWLVMFTASNVAHAAQAVRDITRSDITPSVQPRVALVIGNKNYTHLPALSNPINDAQDVAAELEHLGFKVMLGTDLDQQHMDDDIRAFGNALSANGVGLFYYAGHAMQFDGSNYLIPTNANVEVDTEIKYKGVNVETVLDAMEARGTAVNLVVLDACRNNPIPRGKRSAGTGLAKMDAPIGTLIAYATRAGKVAEDGAGRNGTFTKYFLKYLGTPGLDLESMLRRVRVDVLAETRNTQYPVADGGLTAEFYFVPASPAPNKPTAPAQRPITSGEHVGDALLPEGRVPKVLARTRPMLPEENRRPGDLFRDALKGGGEGPEMVVIPAGRFAMGSAPGSAGQVDDEGPMHTVVFARPIAIGVAEVTFDDYDRFATATGRDKPADKGWGRSSRPVIDVSWDDAVAYTKWLSVQSGRKYRLPSEAEWEYAARAGSTSNYWWGIEVGSNNANCADCGSQWERQTAPVKSFQANHFGLYDTVGNVGEWTADCWNANYDGAPLDGSAWANGECDDRVLRGGAWYFNAVLAQSTGRSSRDSLYRYNYLGFRVAQDFN